MKKFRKLVELGPVGLEPWAEEELKDYADEILRLPQTPVQQSEILQGIGDADAVLLRTQPRLGAEILSAAPQLRYVGMCCSLYSRDSANVDIDFAEKHGIAVSGIRDYGDHGVTEYVLYQLIRILHGYDFPMWRERPLEITGLKVGFVGLGVSGGMTAEMLQHLGAEISYFARAPKPERETAGMHFRPLRELLQNSQVILTCLNKNVILLHQEEFQAMGNGKILFNTSIGPASDPEALLRWISHPSNLLCADTRGALGENADALLALPNVICPDVSAGMTAQAYDLLSRKVLDNIRQHLNR